MHRRKCYSIDLISEVDKPEGSGGERATPPDLVVLPRLGDRMNTRDSRKYASNNLAPADEWLFLALQQVKKKQWMVLGVTRDRGTILSLVSAAPGHLDLVTETIAACQSRCVTGEGPIGALFWVEMMESITNDSSAYEGNAPPRSPRPRR